MNRSDILFESINNFYKKEENREVLINILVNKNNISLRNIEWFVTNYSKNNKLEYKTSDGKNFRVHCAYKASLDGYSKKLFDPFCRTEKFDYVIPDTNYNIKTTVAQLNFLKWCINNDIIDYVSTNKSKLFQRKTN